MTVTASRLRGASRALDQATYQLEAVFKPMVRIPTGGGFRRDDATRTTLVAVAGYARGVAYRVERQAPVAAPDLAGLVAITTTLGSSIDALSVAVTGGADDNTKAHWQRVSGLVDELDRALDAGGTRGAVGHGAGASSGAGATSGAGPTSEAGALSGDPTWLRYRIHALGRIDDALAQLGESYGLDAEGSPSFDATAPRQPSLAAATVRRRFGD